MSATVNRMFPYNSTTVEAAPVSRWEQWERIVRFLSFRREHYCITFPKSNAHAQAVLRDLAKFCRADRTTWDADARTHAALEGRREVWLRIQQHLNLQPEQLAELFGNPEPKD